MSFWNCAGADCNYQIPIAILSGSPSQPYGPYVTSGHKLRVMFFTDSQGTKSRFNANIRVRNGQLTTTPYHNHTDYQIGEPATTPLLTMTPAESTLQPVSQPDPIEHGQTTSTQSTSPVDICKFHPDDIQYIKESFTVSSPDYPDPYHMYNSFDCIMDLTAVGGFYFQITFLDFQVSSKEKLPKGEKNYT